MFIKKNKFLKLFIFSILLIILFCFFDLYVLGIQTSFTKFWARIIPCPVLVVNKSIITFRGYEDFIKDYELYWKEFGPLNKKYNRRLALKSMVRDIALKQIISKLKIDLNEQEFKDYLKTYYHNYYIKGTNKDRFNKYFLKPKFYQKKILEKITDDKFNLKNKKKIEEIYNNLIKDPEKFDEYAHLYKDEDLGIDGNFIAWLSYGDLPESLKERIDKIDVQNFTPIIKSISGYHIYKLNAKIKNRSGNYYYQFSQIFLGIHHFDDYFNNFLQKSRISYLLRDLKHI